MDLSGLSMAQISFSPRGTSLILHSPLVGGYEGGLKICAVVAHPRHLSARTHAVPWGLSDRPWGHLADTGDIALTHGCFAQQCC